jgi:hypothetical protein
MSTRRGFRAAITAGAGVLLVAVLVFGRSSGRTPERTLEIELQASVPGFAQVYWDTGNGFRDEDSSRLSLASAPGAPNVLRFVLPRRTITALRFDPIESAGEVVLKRIRVVDPARRELAALHLESLWPVHQIASMQTGANGMKVVSTGGDPFFFVTASCLDGPAAWYSLSSVTPLSLTLSILATAALLLASLFIIARKVFEPGSEPTMPRPPRANVALWMIAVFLIVLSAKLLVIRHYPAPVPFEDQWTAEAGGLYVPFNEGCLSWRQIAALHNEHRVVFTRLLALGLLPVNGQWDPQLQQVVNAGLHALTAVITAALFWMGFGRRRFDVIALVCALAFALPFGWENTLAGFQSAFYFLVLFSVLSMWLTVDHAPGTAPWLLGWLCALCALVTSAGGLLTPVVLALTPLIRLAFDRGGWRDAALNIAMSAALFILGFALSSPPLPYHEPFKAGTPGALATALARNLAWPWVERPALAVVMWAPFAALVAALGRRLLRPKRPEELIGVLAVWVILQAAALAYARGLGGQAPASRYMDVLSLGFVANAMSLVALLDRAPARRFARPLTLVTMTAWFVVAMFGLERLSTQTLAGGAAVRRAWMTSYVQTVRAFLATDDVAALVAKRYPYEVPYHNAPMLANGWLRHPYVRRILPAAIREPIHLAAKDDVSRAFVINGVYPTVPIDRIRPARGSFWGRGNPVQGRFESRRVGPCQIGGDLKFEVSGYLGDHGLTLAIEPVTPERARLVSVPVQPAERWVPARVACPRADFAVVAVDSTSELWFAFRDPVEIGWASAVVESVLARTRRLFLLAMALCFLATRLT